MRMAKVDWTEYDQKRKNELSAFVRISKKVVKHIGAPTPEPLPAGRRGRGRPPYSPNSLLLVNLLRIYFQMSYRDTVSLLQANHQLRRSLGLESVPTRNTINLYAKTISESYLKDFLARVTVNLKKTESISPSTPPVSRSRGTRDVGKLPRTRSG